MRRSWRARATAALVIAACKGGTDPDCVRNVAGTFEIDPVVGATVTAEDGRATLVIPPGALPTICPAAVAVVPVSELPSLPAQLDGVPGTGVEFRVQYGADFRTPLTLILRYAPAELPAGTSTTELRVVSVGRPECLMRNVYGCALYAPDPVIVRGEAVRDDALHELRLTEADQLEPRYFIAVLRSSFP